MVSDITPKQHVHLHEHIPVELSRRGCAMDATLISTLQAEARRNWRCILLLYG